MGFAVEAAAQSAHKWLREGDRQSKEGAYTEAEDSYRKALRDKKGNQGSFNLGNSIYQQQRFEEAERSFLDALAAATTSEERAAA